MDRDAYSEFLSLLPHKKQAYLDFTNFQEMTE